MSGRIVVFGATGYTGRLTARALVRDGAAPVLAGRSPEKLEALADELGGLEHAVADVDDAASVAALVRPGDVLVTTVGPFTRWGLPALEAAVGAGAHYLDSTGEGPFIQRVFDEYGPRARHVGCALLTAFGYDYVPGNLAGALAMQRARELGGRVDVVRVGYFMTGRVGSGSWSGGTRASALGVFTEGGFAWRRGRMVDERPGRRTLRFSAGGRERPALSVPATEHYALPRLASIREVQVGLGWFGPATRPLSVLSRAARILDVVPPARAAVGRVTEGFAQGSTGGPDEQERARTGSLVVGEALDGAGALLARVELTGPNPYTLTGDLLAWGGQAAASGLLKSTGAIGPVEAFGLEDLQKACAEMGLRESDPGATP